MAATKSPATKRLTSYQEIACLRTASIALKLFWINGFHSYFAD
jgi:hypothetical protein